MHTYQEISSFIWSIADDELRGLFQQSEYGDVILPFTVLRRLDCVLEQQKDQAVEIYEHYKEKVTDVEPIVKQKLDVKFFNASRYDLNRLRGDTSNIMLNFNHYLNGFSQEVQDIIENFKLTPTIQQLNDQKLLYPVIEKFSQIDLHPESVSNELMGQVFEELLRKFNEQSIQNNGQYYTPRDVIQLLVGLVFSESQDDLQEEGLVRSIYDPCVGTGGMLTVGKEYVNKHINANVDWILAGQELNPQTYAICKADMLITGEDPNRIQRGNTLTGDQFANDKYDYMLSNPPFGVSWKNEKPTVQQEAQDPSGRFTAGLPGTADGALLFLQNMLAKMQTEGSRIGIVFNGSPLFTGDAGSGESEIRRHIIENDWLEGIVALPDQMFFNTGINTYLWIVTNKKAEHRKGKVQLLDGRQYYADMKKSLNEKRHYITEQQQAELIRAYNAFEEGKVCQIHDNQFFGYTKVTVEQPQYDDRGGMITDITGKPKPDKQKRDYERIPLSENIEEYFEREVKPHLPDAWMDRNKDRVGYTINFTKYFYQYQPLRDLHEIEQDLRELEGESEGLLQKILED
jgi:type I restriction enzyme M protein